MRLLPALVAAGSLLAIPALAEPGDALVWVQRIANSAQKLNFTGTFTYQSGNNSETSRITHIVDTSGEHERIEVLDGSLRELVRSNDEVKCFLPEEKVVIIESRRHYKAFPGLLPTAVSGLGEFYHIRKGDVARVAGFDSQLIVLEPKDQLRYGHLLWAELESGLLLKARTINERNEQIEQFAFTQVQIGGRIDREALTPRSNQKNSEWRIQNARAARPGTAGGEWSFRTPLPGFKVSAGMKRRAARAGEETTHIVLSDGLASISVFIEPASDVSTTIENGTFSVGAINGYKRFVGKHLVTVLGEVPAATLTRLGDGIEARRR